MHPVNGTNKRGHAVVNRISTLAEPLYPCAGDVNERIGPVLKTTSLPINTPPEPRTVSSYGQPPAAGVFTTALQIGTMNVYGQSRIQMPTMKFVWQGLAKNGTASKDSSGECPCRRVRELESTKSFLQMVGGGNTQANEDTNGKARRGQ